MPTLDHDPVLETPDQSQNRPSLETLLQEVLVKIDELRAGMRMNIQHVLPALPGLDSKFTGEAFVQTVGTVVQFQNGESNFFYTPDAIAMRGRSVERLRESRSAFFNAIAAQLPEHSRVLNIGAGGDMTPIQSFRAAGHEVLSTDMAENTVQTLRNMGGAPAFACDLSNIDKVLPQASMDVIIGNSTLGYIEPGKIKSVIDKLAGIMREGGIFTFDLSPHPRYFDMSADDDLPPIVNSSGPNPYKLLEFIRQYGQQTGIKAMGYFQHYRNESVHLATIQLLKQEFETHGFTCTTGAIDLRGEEGMKTPCLTLRVSKNNPKLLQPVAGETAYDDPMQQLKNNSQDGDPYLLLGYLDRTSGELLAQAFNIRANKKDAPWLVAQHIDGHQHEGKLPDTVKDKILEDLKPQRVASTLRPYIDGKPFQPHKSLPQHLAADQTFHKLVIHGEVPFGPQAADARIDQAYAQYEFTQKEAQEKELQRKLEEQRKDARKREKANKKKNRK